MVATGMRLTIAAMALTVAMVDAASAEVAAVPPTDDACLYEGEAQDGRKLCIRSKSFNADLCKAVEHFSTSRNIPPSFFARLIWRESLFKPEAISPKGAEGIAQFMPGTARLRGLDNSFDVLQALEASALYLAELKARFGNFGLAAAAYNAGEAGLARFLDTGRLPIETQDYVFAITGQAAETWKTTPPEIAAPELEPGKPFLQACITLADTRRINEPVLAGSADWAPWGVQLAAHYNPTIAMRLFTRSVARLPAPLNAERALIVRQKGGNFGRRARYAARIGEDSRAEALTLCNRIRAAGGACTVIRNR